jgi:hypothetical protein
MLPSGCDGPRAPAGRKMPDLPERPGLASDRNMVRMPKDNRPNFDAAATERLVRLTKAARDGNFEEEFKRVFPPETWPENSPEESAPVPKDPKR